MSVINTNVNALYATDALKVNSRAMSSAMQQLSTGSRINSAKDDAAGLAIGQNMTAQIRGLNQAVRNANDGINMMQTAEGAMVEQSNMLQRMHELAVQASNGTYGSGQLDNLQAEFSALSSQIGNIASQTKWNGTTLLDGKAKAGVSASSGEFIFQVGQNSGESITVTFDATTESGLSIASADISTFSGASSALDTLATAIDTINTQRAAIGAGINQLTYAADNLTNISSNISASRSTIMDTDYASASTQLSKSQIIQQAATAMLAQANQQPQSVLALLK